MQRLNSILREEVKPVMADVEVVEVWEGVETRGQGGEAIVREVKGLEGRQGTHGLG